MLVHSPQKQFTLRNVCMNLLQQWSADDCLMLHLDWNDQRKMTSQIMIFSGKQ